MSEKKPESLIRGMVEAFVKNDVEKTLSFFTEDAVWVAPEGTFKGKEELKRYITWSIQVVPNKKFRDTGIGIIVKGDKAVWEYIIESVTSEGMKYETPGICAYELRNGKIQQHRAFYDRLSIGKQVTNGWFAKKVVRAFVNRAEKGLH